MRDGGKKVGGGRFEKNVDVWGFVQISTLRKKHLDLARAVAPQT